jgi:hypothetical protein
VVGGMFLLVLWGSCCLCNADFVGCTHSWYRHRYDFLTMVVGACSRSSLAVSQPLVPMCCMC